MQHLLHDGHRVAYRASGEGPALVFLHGWPTHSGLWTEQIKALETHVRCIAPDWIGHGASDKPLAYEYTFAEKAAELDAVLAHALPGARDGRLERITLVAHDIGGPAALLWASRNTERVERLILLNTVVYPFKTPLDAASETLLHMPLLRDAFVHPTGLRMVLRTNTKSRGPALKQRMDQLLEPWRGVPGMLKRKALSAPLEEGRKDLLHRTAALFRDLHADKHLILAKADALCYAHVQRLAGENPDVPAQYIDNCGHFMPIDRPKAVAQAIASALGLLSA